MSARLAGHGPYCEQNLRNRGPLKPEKVIGEGHESIYVWYCKNELDLANLKGDSSYACIARPPRSCVSWTLMGHSMGPNCLRSPTPWRPARSIDARISPRRTWLMADPCAAANRELSRRVHRRCGVRLRDLGPMRAARREALLELGIGDRRFGWPLEMVVRAAEAGWVISEVPVAYRVRVGKSKVTGTVRGTLRTINDMSAVLRLPVGCSHCPARTPAPCGSTRPAPCRGG